jgi:hypothetical protein
MLGVGDNALRDVLDKERATPSYFARVKPLITEQNRINRLEWAEAIRIGLRNNGIIYPSALTIASVIGYARSQRED